MTGVLAEGLPTRQAKPAKQTAPDQASREGVRVQQDAADGSRYNKPVSFFGTEDGMNKADTPTLRAFALLEHLVKADRPLSLAEIVQDFEAPKASLHRMLAALEAGGLVIREPGGKNTYAIGPRLSQLGMNVVMHTGGRRVRHAILSRLVADLGETCNLTMLNETEVLYLDRKEAPWPLRLDLKPGSQVPVHCSASGKLLLAMLPREERGMLVRTLKLERFTANTITDVELLEAELDRIAYKQIGVDNEEFVAGIACVAAPLISANGTCLAAIAVHAPIARTPLSRAMEFVPRLQEAARELAQTF